MVDRLRRLVLDFLHHERVQEILEVLPFQELGPGTWAAIFAALGLTLAVLLWVFKGEMVIARVVWLGFFLFVGAAAYWGYDTLGPTLRPEARPSDTGPALARSDTTGETTKTPRPFQQSQAVFRREARGRRPSGNAGGRATPETRTRDRDEPSGETRRRPRDADASKGAYERVLDRASRTYETFSGSGEQKTGSFSVPTEWAVLWQNSAHENAFFTVYVLKDGTKMKSVGSHMGPSAGLSETFPPGTYSLRVHGTKSWTVKILEPN